MTSYKKANLPKGGFAFFIREKIFTKQKKSNGRFPMLFLFSVITDDYFFAVYLSFSIFVTSAVISYPAAVKRILSLDVLLKIISYFLSA